MSSPHSLSHVRVPSVVREHHGPIVVSPDDRGDVDALDGRIEVRQHEPAGIRRRGERAHRSEEHTSELQSPYELVCRLLLEKKKTHLTQYPLPFCRSRV